MTSHFADATFAPTIPNRPDVAGSDPESRLVTGWHALRGLPIGILRGMAPGTDVEVCVEDVFEESSDLAVADRVAWILSMRSERQHVVLATSGGYLVVTVSPMLDWAAAMRLEPGAHSPRVVSVANPEGVLPILLPVAG